MKHRFTLLLVLLSLALSSQVITPFTIRYQATQKGGIRYISNTAVTCSGIGCGAGRTEVPPAGTATDNGFTAAYVDIDADGTTFQSSSDSIALPTCSEISWAGLYWGGEMTNAGANYATRNQCKIKTNNGTYVNLTADQFQDNAVGFDTYQCFKDITTIVTAGGTNARYTVANVAARVGGTNRFGGWSIVVVYKNDLQPMRNLTVFNGLSNVSGANPITDITVSGFLTPLSGPVTFEVGNITYDGDRSSTGDQLMFNGGSGFVNISDAVNPLNDIFNSTYSYNGVQKVAPFINPGYTNSLGYDADIFIPNNAAKNYIGNSATSATLRLTTGGETFLTQVVTMAIDVYEPDLRAACRVVDLNGGTVLPGDILEYTIVGKNIGSDPAVNTFITDTLEFNAVYIPGSLQITYGPNSGAKTDAAGDDQAEYIAAQRVIRVRVGTGANAVSGGQMNNSTLGVDSTQIRFRATATTDCIVLQCDNIINNRAYIFGTGNVSGNSWSNGSNPNIFDGFGCPVPGTTNTPISAASCPVPSASSNTPVCTGNTINLTTAPASSIATYSWTGPGGFVSSAANPTRANATVAMAGTYTCVISVPGSSCSYTVTTVVVVNTTPATPAPSSNTPVCTGNTINLSTAAVAGATYSWTGPSAFASALQNPTRPGATVAMAGTYSVTVTANGCTSAVGTTAVVVNTTPATPTPSSNTPVCTGNTINLSTAAVAGATYSWTGPSAFASALQNPTRPGATVAMAGTYSVTVTANGCTSGVGTTAVVVNTTPATPTASSNTPVCTGNTINLSTPAVAGATYSWTGPNSFASSVQNPSITGATVAMAGTYSVTVTTSGCTSAVGTTAVVINTTPATPAPSSNSPVCTGNTINLSTAAVAGATYSWTGPNSFASSVQNPSITGATVAMAGTYSLTVTANGCTSGVGTTAVVVNATPATPTASSNTPVCTGNMINLSTPAVAGATYSWTGPNSFASSVQNPSITGATVAMAGTYSVTVTASGCTSGVGTTAVVINTTPATPTASSNSPVCTGNTINLSTPAVAGATYSWTGPSAFASALQNPTRPGATVAMAGTYSVTVTANGCTSGVGTTAVVVNTTPATPTASSNSPVCTGNTINLSTPAVAGATYSWTGPNSFSSLVQNPSITGATVAMAGTYSVTVTASGCTSGVGTTAVVVNTTPATPTASSNTPVCTGNTINLSTPAVAGATYSWTGPNSFASSVQNPSITGATVAMAGTYSITVTANGCTSGVGTTAVVVNATPATPTPSSNSPVCTGNTINLSTAAVAGATYSWTGPSSFASALQNPTRPGATVAMAGTYSLTVTANGCTSGVGTTAVVVNTTPATPTASSNTPVCSGNTLNLSTPAVGGATYSWTGPNSFSSSVQNPAITSVTTAATGTYSVTVTVNGCTSGVGTTPVVINATPATPAPSSNSPVCTGNTINLSTAAVASATYSWTGPNSFSSSVQNPSITGSTLAMSGTYSVTVTVGGCTSAVGTTVVSVNNTPSTPAPSSNSPVCEGSALNLSTATVGGATYSWTGPNSFSSSLQNPTIAAATAAAAGTYSLTVSIGGCTSGVGTTAVTITPLPATPSASGNSPVCTGNAINLSTPTVAGATYSWTGPNSFSSSLQNPTIASAVLANGGTYSVTITVSGCTSAAGTVSIVVNATPATPVLASNSPVCSGNAVNLSTTSIATTYAWTGPNSFTSSVQNPTIAAATTAASGTYSLVVTENGCSSFVGTTAVVVDSTPPMPSVSSNSPVCEGNAINLSTPAVVGATYSWTGPNSFSSSLQNPSVAIATLADAGTYSVTITVGNCTSAAGSTAVVVNATPATPIASTVSPVCATLDILLFADTIPGATYSWFGPNSYTSSSQNPIIPNSTTSMSGDYWVTVTINGCVSLADTVTVQVDSCADTDGDGVFDPYDPDDDNDGVTDVIETNGDTDGDGVPNSLDLDSDNDGITDVAENGGADADGNGIIDGFTDADNDGLADAVDPSEGGTPIAALDSDGDGAPNYLDLDSDNDGILDIIEVGGTDADNNGQVDATTDANNNGLDDSVDPATSGTPIFTTGTDTNNDGRPDSYPGDNTDTNGLPNFLDIDSDDDGIVDNIEAQSSAAYIAPSGTDTDGDGIDDAYDLFNGFGGAGVTPVNTDGASDGADYVDTDADNDTMPDSLEGWDTNNDGTADTTPSGVDSDNDGLDDAYDTNTSGWNPSNGQTPNSFPNLDNTATPELDWRETDDNDGDGIVNSLDPDDDNDGIPDITEGTGDTDGDGVIDAFDLDSDNDGIVDVIESGGSDPDGDGIIGNGPIADADGDGLSDIVDPDNGGTPLLVIDTDGDGIPNTLDLDSDNDGITDVTEAGGTDANGDGIIDGFTDSDGDGLADSVDSTVGGTPLPTEDTDGDGHYDYTDLDSDNDGITDVTEAGGTDANGDGIIDGFVDTDGDGLADSVDPDNSGTPLLNPDTDGDGIVNVLDLDSDNDGIADVAEAGGTDTNGDGIIDGFTDSDNDGLSDNVDPSVGGTPLVITDTDGDGHANYLDLDSDNDGIPDVIEAGGTDANGDGIIDAFADSNGNGLSDNVDSSVGGTPLVIIDTDGDGHANYLDLDSDNDGIADVVEAGGTDANGDGLIDGFTDTDNDGLADSVDSNNGGTALPVADTDGDGHANYIDLDSDNDGITDLAEAGGTDANGDGHVDVFTDGDGDGFADANDTDNGGTALPVPDTDGDGHANYLDLDSDNDGITDVIENGGVDADGDGHIDNFTDSDNDGLADSGDPSTGGTPFLEADQDADGIPNYLDLDSDNDGIVDLIESGGTDANNDGIIDGFTDSDNDGLADSVDPSSSGTPNTTTGTDSNNDGRPDSYPNDNADGSGLPNYLDIDADDDGIVDNIEGQPTTGYVAPTGNDTDGDGIDDAYDTISGFGGAGVTPVNTDGTDTPDYIDTDADNDGFSDLVEGNDFNNDNQPDTPPSGNDTDGDGLDDAYDNVGTIGNGNAANNDGPATGTTFPDVDVAGGELDWRDPMDTDHDGISNVDDIDDDNDGILDVTENATASNSGDTDHDGVPDSLDLDSDNDGIPDIIEANGSDPDNDGMVGTGPITDSNGDGLDDSLAPNGLPFIDTDGDGHPDFQDLDSDNDGITDLMESGSNLTDANGDGIVDGNDSDFDGLIDQVDAGNGGVLTGNPDDTDGDGIDDYRELDSDNDGIADVIEGGGTDVNGDGHIDNFVDADNDGYDDNTQASSGNGGPAVPDTDGDGHPDYLDLDSDNDGIADVMEGGSPDANGDGLVDNFTDANGDGWDDNVQNGSGNGGPAVPDSDGDGHPDYLDLDSDNDGIADVIEGGSPDSNGDGILDNFTDNDNDGWDDNLEASNGNAGPPVPDSDGDGHPDYLDLDSDNDGIPDVTEGGGIDANGDGVIDNFTDADGDGWDDNVETGNGNAGPPVPDSDGDGIPDYLDLDSDNDGITDVVEGGGVDTNGDGTIDNFTDLDGDGWDDNVETGNGNAGPPVPDSDGDGHPDYLDLDSDNDGIPDVVEGGGADVDGNGTVDNWTDNDGDGWDDNTENGNGNAGPPVPDTDGDGIPDYLDLDSDGDGITDAIEGGGADANGDGIIDNFTDLDGDGWDDNTENGNGNAGPPVPDTDGDGTPDYLDVDSDGDGINDGTGDETLLVDCDGDGISNYLDPDPCTLDIPSGFSPNNDGINDIFEIVGIAAYPDNKVTIFNRWGSLVYEGTGYNNTTVRWDGTNTGELSSGNGPVPEGTYFYVIDLGDGSPILSGYIYLNRK